MDKIEWIESGDGRLHIADIGSIRLVCYAYIDYRRTFWAKVRIDCVSTRQGPNRSSLDQAKEDAIDIAKNMLLDTMFGLKKEMASFGLEDMWDEEN